MRKNYLFVLLAILFTMNVMAQNIPSYLPKDGLVGFWPFNGNANDESGNGNHGTVNGATLTNDRNGVSNSAYNFDGLDDFISTNYSGILGSSSRSVSFWAKQSSKNIQTILGWGSNVCGPAGIAKGFYCALNISTNSTSVNGISFDANESSITYKTIFPVDDNIWHHYVFVKETNSLSTDKIKIYQDGILLTQAISNYISGGTVNTTSEAKLIFGKKTFTCVKDRFYSGNTDDISIHNRALTDQEIAKLYAGCTKETATSSNFNTLMYTTNAPVNLIASPTGGTFSGNGVTNNAFNPSKAKLGKNQVKYNFKNTTGCADSTNFTMILVDTLGNKCSTYDTLKIKVKLTTGIKAGQQTSMNVYPNPTSDKLIIETNDIQALSGYKYKILDIQGKEVYNALATSAKTEISLKSIGTKGMYILHIVDEKGVSIENKKIVLE